MSLFFAESQSALASVHADAVQQFFHPRGTVRCVGTPMFRTQLARDLACLLDIDRDVISWSCLPLALSEAEAIHVPDFIVERTDGAFLADAYCSSDASQSAWISAAATRVGYGYEVLSASQIRSGFRLRNAQDLLRYARWQCPLGDRVRLLAALDEHASLTIAEAIPAFREVPPIAGLASLALHRFIEIDFDEAVIGPETALRRAAV